MREQGTRLRGVGRAARWSLVAALLAALCAVIAPGVALAAGTVTSFAPTSGPAAGGTNVVITGTGLTDATGVSFGTAPAAAFTITDDTQITATAPPGAAGSVDLTVAFSDGPLTVGSFTYVAAPTVTAVAPAAGPLAGNGMVTITGTGFQPGAAVTFDGVAAPDASVVNDTTISATPPDHIAGAVAVAITNPDTQVGALANGFTYVAAPTIASLGQTTGPAAGGTAVTITGTNLTGVTAVAFGGVAATGVSATNDTTVVATTPAHAVGSVDVAVTTPGDTATAPGAFTFIAGPTITAITPATGSTDDDETTPVVITGTNFQPGATVTFGDVAALNIVVVNGTTIAMTAPMHAAGAVNVVITNPDGQSATQVGGFTYVGPPTVTGISPASGPVAGGTVVTITGAGFQPGARVFFDGAAATNVVVNDAMSITATTPATNHGRTVNVAVQNVGSERGTLPRAFTYTGSGGSGPPASGALSVKKVEPSSGPTTGGARIVIEGTGFTAGMTVTIGGAPATDVRVLNGKTISATTPAHASEGAVDVIVSGGGQSVALPASYTYGIQHEGGPGRRGGDGGSDGGSHGGGDGGSHGGSPGSRGGDGGSNAGSQGGSPPSALPSHR